MQLLDQRHNTPDAPSTSPDLSGRHRCKILLSLIVNNLAIISSFNSTRGDVEDSMSMTANRGERCHQLPIIRQDHVNYRTYDKNCGINQD